MLLDFSWKVLPDLHGSDHFPIILTSAEGEPRTRLPRWRIERTDWQLITELCSTARTVDSFGSTDEATAYLSSFVHSAAIVSFPMTSGHFLYVLFLGGPLNALLP